MDTRETEPRAWSVLAQEVCGECDGLLVFEPGPTLRLRMFNPDGTEDFCGNGLLCAGAYAYRTDATTKTEFVIQHLGRDVPVSLDLAQGSATMLLPPPRFDAQAIPMSAPHEDDGPAVLELEDFPYPVYPVSTGTAHAVVVVDALPEDETFFRLSPILENHEVFPERATVDWVTLGSAGSLMVRIWERGVGETLGCGTGAAAIAATMLGVLHEGAVDVLSKGGALRVQWMGDGPIKVTGTPSI